ncbi:unannotated protein [freshwater metagenome]|uniref:Unannotated protein n=1 Tax=freshwater metagenome TaxID=449393 RepID=A0A6J7KGT4_9ZZZZ
MKITEMSGWARVTRAATSRPSTSAPMFISVSRVSGENSAATASADSSELAVRT